MSQTFLHAGDLTLALDASTWALTLSDSVRRETLVALPAFGLLLPGDAAPDFRMISATDDRIEIEGITDLFRASIVVEGAGRGLIFGSQIEVREDFRLSRLEVFPSGTELNLYDVVNFRNRHYTQETWPEQPLGGKGCATDTFSRDWQFAPHPSMMMFRKREVTLCLGAVDLPTAFGLYLRVADFVVEDLSFDYGRAGHELELRAGDLFSPPRCGLFLDRGRTPYETARRYSQLLIDEGAIPDPARRERHAWHLDPLYCTWMDQGYVARETPPAELGEQQLSDSNPTVEALSEPFVRDILACMDAEGLDFKTFLLDDGWQVLRGQWEAETSRFPDLRGLVDRLHARGMKVIVWWNWAELFDGAEADPAHLAGEGWRNEHGRRVRDYSDPRTQEEYLRPLFHRLFSSDPGCYDFDGFKSDFLADKVHPQMPLHDPAWRGEETYCYRLFELCYRSMKAIKEDACHVGCAGHPYLAQFIDINRTYDVATSNAMEHANRAEMLKSLTPGCPVAFDLHNFVERFDEYFDLARAQGASVHVGNILGMREDRLSPWVTANERLYGPIRRGLAMLNPKEPDVAGP